MAKRTHRWRTWFLVLMAGLAFPVNAPSQTANNPPVAPHPVLEHHINSAPATKAEELARLPPLDFFLHAPFSRKLISWARDCATVVYFEKDTAPYVELKGKLRAGYQLWFNYENVPLVDHGFHLRVELPETPRLFVIELRAPNGQRAAFPFRYRWIQDPPKPFHLKIAEGDSYSMNSVDFIGNFPSRDWLAFSWISAGELNPFEIELGIARFQYSETTQNSITILGVEIAASYRYALFTSWAIFGRVSLLAFPLSTVGSAVTTRLLQTEIGSQRELPRWSPLTTIAQLSYHYLTLLTPDHAYGFANIGGPRLNVSANYPLTLRKSLRLETALGFFNSDTSLLALGNHDFDVRAFYVWRPLAGLWRWGLGLEADFLSLTFSNGHSSVTTLGLLGLVSF